MYFVLCFSLWNVFRSCLLHIFWLMVYSNFKWWSSQQSVCNPCKFCSVLVAWSFVF